MVGHLQSALRAPGSEDVNKSVTLPHFTVSFHPGSGSGRLTQVPALPLPGRCLGTAPPQYSSDPVRAPAGSTLLLRVPGSGRAIQHRLPHPGCTMGNLPSAAKHCLSYQQLLREHLWSGESVAGALDPAQVPPRGLGRPHPPTASSPPTSPVSPLCHLCMPAALLSVCGSAAEKLFHPFCCEPEDSSLQA